jgi:hypothetical protein
MWVRLIDSMVDFQNKRIRERWKNTRKHISCYNVEADVEILNTMVSKKDRKRVLVEFNLSC